MIIKGSIALLAMLIAAGPALAQHGQPPAEQPAETKSLQGGANSEWTDSPHIHAFYDLTVETLGKGTEGIDFETYRDKSYALFRAFGASMGWKAGQMEDHLKDIPRQVVGIVKDDPKVLVSYDKFMLAMMGPP